MAEPIVTPASPTPNTEFNITCNVTSGASGVDCLAAYVDDLGHACTWVPGSWRTIGGRAYVDFNCSGTTTGTHNAVCVASTGTGSNCCDDSAMKPFDVYGCDHWTDEISCTATTCKWCDECDGNKVNMWQQDKCVDLGTDCGYHCEIGECGADCTDTCLPYIDANYCHYDRTCTDCLCSDGSIECCPEPGKCYDAACNEVPCETGSTCYYGSRTCSDGTGCGLDTCALAENQYCNATAGCKDICILQGGECSETSECCPGLFCVDGYCCDSQCDGNCDRCDVAGQEGTCTDVDAECTGNCDACVNGNCVPDQTMCTGDCDVCQGSGTSFNCQANVSLCECYEDCRGSGTEFNCYDLRQDISGCLYYDYCDDELGNLDACYADLHSPNPTYEYCKLDPASHSAEEMWSICNSSIPDVELEYLCHDLITCPAS